MLRGRLGRSADDSKLRRRAPLSAQRGSHSAAWLPSGIEDSAQCAGVRESRAALRTARKFPKPDA